MTTFFGKAIHGRRMRGSFSRRRQDRQRRRAATVVWVAMTGVLFISLIGLAMDAAIMYLAGTHLQIAADAASMAAARLVRSDDLTIPRNAAYSIAYENMAAGLPVRLDLNADNVDTGEIVIGRYHRFSNSEYCSTPPCCITPPCFFPDTTSPNAVRVRARRVSGAIDGQIPLVFGRAALINVLGVNVARTATAMISGGTGSGLITLDPSGDCSLQMSGDVIVDLTSAEGWDGDTAVQVNSTSECAFCGDGSSWELHAPETNIVGSEPGYCFRGDPILDTYINPDSPSMPDPLAYLEPPPIGANLGEITSAGYYGPGYYSGGVNLSGNADVVVNLGPGIYVVEGDGNQGGFQTRGSVSLIAQNVMIYLKSGKLDLAGTGQTVITPMTEEINTDPYYIGVSIFQARDNDEPARIIGTADMDLQGTFYFPNNLLEVGGEGIALGNQLIAWRLYLHGTGTFDIQYDGRFPAPGSKVFLVQ